VSDGQLGLTGLTGDGTASITFTGTVAQINAAVAGLTYTNTPDYNGTDSLTITLRDDGRDNGTATGNGILSATPKVIPITITPVGDISPDSVTTLEDTPITFNVLTGTNGATVDSFEGTPIVTAVSTPGKGTVSFSADGTIVYTPAANANGQDQFTYTVTSGGVTETTTVTVNITPVNDRPAAANDSYAVGEHSVLSVPLANGLLANDTDVDTAHSQLAVSLVNGNAITSGAPIALPSGAILTQKADGSFVYNPNGAYASLKAGQTAADTFTYQVSDGAGGVATATATVTITGVNDAPVALNDTNSTDPQVAISADAAHGVLVNDTDADTAHNLLTVTGVTNGTASAGAGIAIAGSNGGTFTINSNGSYSFDPGHDFDSLAVGASATTSVTYTVSDGQGGSTTATLTISVPYENLPPYVAQTVPAQTSQDGNGVSISLANVFSDPNPNDQGHLTIDAIGLPPGLGLDASGNITGTLTPNASQHAGPYVVTVTATDLSGSKISTTFNFNVTNPAPVAVADTNTVLEHGTTAGNVLTNDKDGGADNDLLAVTQVNGVAYTAGNVITLGSGAQIVMATNGTYSYDPHGAFDGLGLGQSATDSFTYQVSDGQGGFATATATITIQGQNDAPVVVDPAKPGTPPANPNQVVPAQTGQDGTLITPVSVASYFHDPDVGDTLILSLTGVLPAGIMFDPAPPTPRKGDLPAMASTPCW
jgi:VCBS repeat-containing protein